MTDFVLVLFMVPGFAILGIVVWMMAQDTRDGWGPRW